MSLPTRRRTMLAALTATLLAGFFSTAHPAPADASISSVERQVITWINEDRKALGLRPYVGWSKLYAVAETRAKRMASANVMNHTIGGNLSSQLTSAGVKRWSFGENVAYTSRGRGLDAAKSIYNAWKNSSTHWGQIKSRTYNYVGIGLAYRSSNGRTFASLIFTESPDHTGAKAAVNGGTPDDNDIVWTWRGSDVPLQTHMAGFRDFDVQYRVDGGSWRWGRDNTTATTLTMWDRPHGHWYSLRVRGTDKAGNVGKWSAEVKVWLP